MKRYENYYGDLLESSSGDWVRYEDAIAAVAQERERCAGLAAALEALVSRCNAECLLAADDAVISAETALDRLNRTQMAERAPTPQQPETTNEPTRQYYYRVGDCQAEGPDSPDCICWHDEGAGPRPLPDEQQGLTWRTKPP